MAGVKVVGDFYRNYELGLPSELALLNLFDPATGVPIAVIDASDITDMRTGAVTAIGARALARRNSKVLGHIGARGTAYWNVRLLAFDLRVRRDPRPLAPARRAATPSPRDCAPTCPARSRRHRRLGVLRARRRHRRRGVAAREARAEAEDRVDQAGRLRHPLRHDERGRALAHRHHGQDRHGRLGPGAAGPYGALRAHVDSGRLSEQNLHAELGQIVAGLKPGRESDAETNLFWHRGLSLSDIALGAAMLAKAERLGIGQRLRFR